MELIEIVWDNIGYALLVVLLLTALDVIRRVNRLGIKNYFLKPFVFATIFFSSMQILQTSLKYLGELYYTTLFRHLALFGTGIIFLYGLLDYRKAIMKIEEEPIRVLPNLKQR